MNFRAFATWALVVAAVNAQSCPEVPADGCNVCGDQGCVQNADALFIFPGQPTVECGILQMAGFDGQIPLDQCPFLPSLIGDCECGTPAPGETTEPPVEPTTPPVEPTEPPVEPSTPPVEQTQPTALGSQSCPEVPADGCNVCGDQGCVQNADALFIFPGQPTVECGILQMAGFDGQIPLDQCPFLPSLVGDCECGTPAPGETPEPPVEPTTPPVEPTEPPVEPTEPPDEPTPPPVEPTETPVEPSTPPVAQTQPTALGSQSCPEVPADGCNVCGDQGCVQNADALFIFPGQPTVECGVLQMAGFDGQIPLDQCPFLPSLVGDCECGTPAPGETTEPPVEPTTPPVEPTEPPVEPTTPPVEPTEPPAVGPQSCPEVPADGCNVCGDQGCVQNADALFIFPGQPTVECGVLQMAGFDGQIPLDQCPFLPSLVGDCECGTPAPGETTEPPVEPTTPPVEPTEPPVEPTTPPVEPTEPPAVGPQSCPEVPADGCNVCGDQGCVQNADAIFIFPGQPTVECGVLQMAGFDGQIPLDQCAFLPPLVGACECGTPAPGETPEPPVEPTTPPVEPTEPPVEPTDPPDEPTEPPAVEPTEPPVGTTVAPVIALPTSPPLSPQQPPTDTPVATPTFPPVVAPAEPPGVAPVMPSVAPIAPIVPSTPKPVGGMMGGGMIGKKAKKDSKSKKDGKKKAKKESAASNKSKEKNKIKKSGKRGGKKDGKKGNH